MQPWTTLKRESLLDCGKFLRVESHTIALPDGQLIPDWPWIITPDFVNIVAVTPDDHFICFRQTKYSVGETLGIAGGYLEPGESPLAAARRELLEETGYVAPDWSALGQFAVDGNRGSGTAHLFLARGAHPVTDPDADDLEELTPLLLSRAELIAALTGGAFKVLPWSTALALALLRLRSSSA